MDKQETEYNVNIMTLGGCGKEFFSYALKVNAKNKEEAKQKGIELLSGYDVIIHVDVNLSDDLITKQ